MTASYQGHDGLIRFHCPDCNKRLKGDLDVVGKRVLCKRCFTKFRVPPDWQSSPPPVRRFTEPMGRLTYDLTKYSSERTGLGLAAVMITTSVSLLIMGCFVVTIPPVYYYGPLATTSVPGQILCLFAAVSLYLLPTSVAILRWHQDRWMIATLNVIYGWTVFVWIIALVWAFTKGRNPDRCHD